MTTNQDTRTWFDTSGNFKTDALRNVTEKFIPQDENMIVYEVTVTDPTIYTQPWTARWNIGRNRTATMSDKPPLRADGVRLAPRAMRTWNTTRRIRAGALRRKR